MIRDEKLKQIYSSMLKCRMLAERFAEQTERASSRRFGVGQEAALIGCSIDLGAEDVLAASPRDLLIHDVFPNLIQKKAGRSLPMLAFSTQLRAGNELALARLQAKRGGVVMALRCEGSLPAASWETALAFASAHQLPIVFGVRMRPGKQTGRVPKATELHLQAERHGVPGIPVDGADAIAVYRVAYEAIKRARQGGGPTFIECTVQPPVSRGETGRKTGQRKRLPHHSAEESAETDPVERMERHLTQKGFFRPAWKGQLIRRFSKELASVTNLEN